MRKFIIIFTVFIIPSFLLNLCCSDKGTNGDDGNGDEYTATQQVELVASKVIEGLFIAEPIFAPDGNGGFYFMDKENHVDTQRFYHIDNEGVITDIGFRPSNLSAALGYEGAAGDFTDLGCDANDWVYFILNFVYESEDYIWILYANPVAESLRVWASDNQLHTVFDATTAGASYFTFYRTRMQVCPDGSVWLYTNNGDNHVVMYLFYQDDMLYYRWGNIPTQTGEPDHPMRVSTGLAADGDFFITDHDASIVWRCDKDAGVSGFMSLEGFPNTTSAIAEDGSNALYFATNYTLDYDISVLEEGFDGDVTLLTTVFTDGYDWLFFAPKIGDQYYLFNWNSSDIALNLGGEEVPQLWRFMLDPVTNEVFTMDESNGDIYKLLYVIE